MNDLVRWVYTGSECRAIDQYAIEVLGIPGIQLMRRAARFAMNELLRRWPETQRISIICGSGNNAGDGYLLAVELKNRQLDVEVVQIADPTRLTGDALRSYQLLVENSIEITRRPRISGDVVVDALLGTGVKGTVRADYVDAMEMINQSGKPVLSLDLPSGIDADTGALLTENPVQAKLTTCFVGRKLALLTGSARNYAGEITWSSLGIPYEAFTRVEGLQVLPRGESEAQLPQRLPASHKGNSGHVLIVAGNSGMGGAALLAGEACLRSGAGLVSMLTHQDHASNVLTRRPELMVHGSPSGNIDPDLLERVDAVAIGPGLGQDAWARNLLGKVLQRGPELLVIDADGLNGLKKWPMSVSSKSVLTPHPGEAATLLGCTTQEVESNRLQAANDISKQFGATVILKGAGSLVSYQGKPIGINDVAEPALSTAGSGDVLTGIVAAMLAQVQDPVQAATLGTYLHSQAGLLARRAKQGRAVIATDLIDAIRPWG